MIDLIQLIQSDWKRYTRLHKKMNPLLFLAVLFKNPGMHFSLLYRIERYLLFNNSIFWKMLGLLLYSLYYVITYYILDIDISPKVKIGKSLYIHNRGIVVTDGSVAGNNLSLIGPLTFGVKELGAHNTSPLLGNNVIVYTGARVIGSVKIGNNVTIGANAVVVRNIPSNCVVGGVPAKIIKRLK